jgi:pimeloyl-ACP methyl ester carboxylesterase
MTTNRTALLAGLGAAFALLLLLGPRPVVDEHLRPVDLPADLEAYLAASEAHYPDLIPGAEKTIIWAGPDTSRRLLSVVYLHGFSATRQETRPLADTVATRLGAHLFYTRLTGHGRSDDAMAEASINDWLNDAAEALAIGRRLGERVVLIGTSTGATLAAWLAAQPGADALLALVLVSPNFGPKDPASRLLLWPWGTQLAQAVVGEYYVWQPANADHARFWKTHYPSRALVPMMGLVDLVHGLDLGRIQIPTLFVYSPNDQVVDPERIASTIPRFGSRENAVFVIDNAGDPSDHVLAGAILSPEQTLPVADRVLTFLKPLLPVDSLK